MLDGNTALNTQSSGYMECIDENFLAVVTGDPTMADAPLDWMLVNKEGLGI